MSEANGIIKHHTRWAAKCSCLNSSASSDVGNKTKAVTRALSKRCGRAVFFFFFFFAGGVSNGQCSRGQGHRQDPQASSPTLRKNACAKLGAFWTKNASLGDADLTLLGAKIYSMHVTELIISDSSCSCDCVSALSPHFNVKLAISCQKLFTKLVWIEQKISRSDLCE